MIDPKPTRIILSWLPSVVRQTIPTNPDDEVTMVDVPHDESVKINYSSYSFTPEMLSLMKDDPAVIRTVLDHEAESMARDLLPFLKEQIEDAFRLALGLTPVERQEARVER